MLSIRKPYAWLAALLLSVSAFQVQAIPIELGIAIDASGSIGSINFTTQRNAYISALSDPTVIPLDGSVAIGIVRFASGVTTIFPMTVIDAGTIGSLITAVTNMGYTGGSTNIAGAIDTLTASIFGNAIASDKQVIDVSTDGYNNIGNLGTSVNNAIAAGIDQINCLGIGGGANCSFIAGTGAFSTTISTFQELEAALKLKLKRETGQIPEPGGLLIFGLGLIILGYTARRRILSR